MSNSKIRMDQIDDSDRLRPIDHDHVEVIAASIAQQGLLQPIRVRPADGGYKLVLGAHRLAALKLLKREELTVGEEVLIAEAGDYSAKVDEIDENLARHELNALDRAIFLAKRKEFYELANPVASRGGDRRSKSQSLRLDFSSRFTKAAAKKIGLSERTIQLAIEIAGALDSEAIRRLRGTKIENNQKELFALSRLSPEDQRSVAYQIGARLHKTTAQAKLALGLTNAPLVTDPEVRLYAQFIDVWSRMKPETRVKSLAEIGAELVKAPKGKALK